MKLLNKKGICEEESNSLIFFSPKYFCLDCVASALTDIL